MMVECSSSDEDENTRFDNFVGGLLKEDAQPKPVRLLEADRIKKRE